MAHSPLKMFTDLHDKHVLVVGQGPLKDIATMYLIPNIILVIHFFIQAGFYSGDTLGRFAGNFPSP